MKNLKKVLALVLVVATLMGFATVAGAQFTDDSSVTYKEAVEVMAAIDVINGYTDGTFRPAANVTRAQMAKMVTFILNKGNDVGDLYKSANTFGDCTTHWARGYIAYASKTGIIAGVGNGMFKPENAVTGTQAAKMLLCALGYDANTEGYTGVNWAVNTLADAKSAGLLKGLNKVDMSAPLSREAAAQMMFNALQADMVEYDRGDIVVGSGDNQVIIGGSAAKKVENKDSKNNYNDDSDDKVMQLCENYFEDLKLIDKADTIDDYGRPAHEWKYGKDSIGSYGDEPVATYTEGFSKDEVADLEKDYDFDADTKYYVNGAIDNTLTGADKIAERDYKGTVIELYADDDDDITNVVLVQAYAAEVTTLTKTTITLKVYNPWAGNKYVSVSFKDDKDKDDDTFDTLTASYEKGDYLLTYFKGADVKTGNFIEAAAIESFDGKVSTTKITAADGYNGYFTVDGTKYNLASAYNEVEIKAGDSYTFYTDANGYVIAAVASEETAASIDDVYYIANVWDEVETSYGSSKIHWYAQLVAMDGTISEVELETKVEKEDEKEETVAYDADAVTGNLVTISDKSVKDESGETVCKSADEKFNVKVWKNDDWNVVSGVVGTFEKNSTRFVFNKVTYRLNSDTQYLLVSEAGQDLSASVKTGGIAYTANNDKGNYAYIITEDGSEVVKYVVIGSSSEISEGQTYSEDAIYLAEKDAYEEGDGYYAHTVYLPDGTEETWQLDDEYEAGFYTYDKNSDGYYTLKEANSMGSVEGVWDEQEGVITGNFVSLFQTLVTVNKTEDIETADAVVVDVHDVDGEGQYDATVSTLDELDSLKSDKVIKSATLSMNVSKDGAVVIFITSVVAGE